MLDLIFRGGTVIDGNRAPGFRADIGIQGDKIARIADLTQEKANQELDIAGLNICPGFIDVHNHSDGWLLLQANFLPKTTQGFTTEVIMADGVSYAPVDRSVVDDWMLYLRPLNGLLPEHYRGWQSLTDYMTLLDRKTAQNIATHIPYGNLRSMACGFGRAEPDDFQVEEMQAAVSRGMDEGAVGLSTGLEYVSECFATTHELIEACRAMSAKRGLYVTHVRYKKGTLEGVQEAIEIGKRADVPVHISHLKATNPEQREKILSYIDNVAVKECDFSFDVYPYFSSATMLSYMLPYEVWVDGPVASLEKLKSPVIRERFGRYLHNVKDHDLERICIGWLPGERNRPFIGRSLGEFVRASKKQLADALADLLIEEKLAVFLVIRRDDDSLVHPFLAHEKFMLGTDGVYFPDGAVHPRMFGSPARLLGSCVRKHRLFSLEDAVYKMTAYPAKRFGLKNRGQIAEGYFADLVVFDPAIEDHATYDTPNATSTGVRHVLVNGRVIIQDGTDVSFGTSQPPGRFLRFNRDD